MEIPELPYTVPRLAKGRTVTKVPGGGTLEKDVAKQSWYIEFFYSMQNSIFESNNYIKHIL